MFLNPGNLTDGEIWLKLIRTAEANEKLMYVPTYYFHICRCLDNKEVGICDLRIGHNENTRYGGNIGYSIKEEYRGHHYAGKAGRQLLELARRHDLEYVCITCAPENVASQKTCEFMGAELEGIVDVPEWHDLHKDGQPRTCYYRVQL